MMGIGNQKDIFIEEASRSWEIVGEGVKRKIIAYTEEVMLVKVAFAKGSIGAVHQHVHTQMTHIESGSFEVEVGGKKQVLKAGDAFFIPSNEWHGVVCIEPGILIDVFSPMRNDFIPGNQL
jgi:quercetin dioxygenase-like cupin family protein